MSNEATRVRRDPVRLTLRMFARVFGEGLTPELKDQLFELPEFRDLLSGRESCNAEAEHQTVLGFNVFPVGTFYLKTIADTIHPHVDLIHACYEESGMETSDLDAIDHISAELTFLSSCGDDHLRTLFIDRHLIGWLPIFTTALRRHGNPLYQRVSELTLLLVLDLRRNLAGPISPALLPGSAAIPDLEESGTGIRDVTEFLTCPGRCGIFLTRRSIQEIGRCCSIPSGFGRRESMLQSVFNAAATYDVFDGVVSQIRDVVSDQRGVWNNIQSDNVETTNWAMHWERKLDETDALLSQLSVPTGTLR